MSIVVTYGLAVAEPCAPGSTRLMATRNVFAAQGSRFGDIVRPHRDFPEPDYLISTRGVQSFPVRVRHNVGQPTEALRIHLPSAVLFCMPDSKQVYDVNALVLDNPANEDGPLTLDYYLNACRHLLNVLHADPRLHRSELAALLEEVFAFLEVEPSERDSSEAEEVAKWLGLFGVVGKALWFLRKKDDAQLLRELTRLATEPRQVIGTQYLFYIAGTLAANGYDVEFVAEQGGVAIKTPDLRASKRGKITWIEANAKNPVVAVDTVQRLAWLVRDIIEEKKMKFTNSVYSPGLIVAEISPAQHLVNESGVVPRIALLPDIRKPLLNGGFLYRLYDDPEWNTRPENNGNVVAYVVNEFSQIDRAKHHVYQCLITMTRRVFKSGNQLAFPKYHLLVVDRSAERDALTELARIVYVV